MHADFHGITSRVKAHALAVRTLSAHQPTHVSEPQPDPTPPIPRFSGARRRLRPCFPASLSPSSPRTCPTPLRPRVRPHIFPSQAHAAAFVLREIREMVPPAPRTEPRSGPKTLHAAPSSVPAYTLPAHGTGIAALAEASRDPISHTPHLPLQVPASPRWRRRRARPSLRRARRRRTGPTRRDGPATSGWWRCRTLCSSNTGGAAMPLEPTPDLTPRIPRYTTGSERGALRREERYDGTRLGHWRLTQPRRLSRVSLYRAPLR